MCIKRKTTNRTSWVFFNSVVRFVIHNITEELLQFVKLEYTHGHHYCDKDNSQRDFGNVSVAFGFFKRVLNKYFLSSTVTAFHFISYQVKILKARIKTVLYWCQPCLFPQSKSQSYYA